jgi:hypothetical protein
MTASESVPQPDHAPDHVPGHVPDRPPASRRAFIAGAGAATVAGAAAVGTAGSAAAGTAAATVTTSDGDATAAGGSGPAVVAYVRDLASGEVRVMSGEREVVVRDRALARTLARHLDAQEG